MALFVIVYFFAPAAIGAPEDVALPSPTQSAMPAAESWLQAIDNGDYQRAYLSMGQMFRERYSQQEMSTLLENERSVLGPAVSRTLNATSNAVNPPGQPRGHYQVYGFRTRFRNEARPIYEAVQLVGEDGVWKVIGFFTYVRTPDGQMVSYEPPETQTQGSDQAESSNSGKEVH